MPPTLEAAAQVLEGLAHAHAHGIVHRDVKPANVLLVDGRGISVKLFDFGLALMHEEQGLTAHGDIPGTLAYISPERLRGDAAGPPADVWAVGVLLWESLAGFHPFWGGTLDRHGQGDRQGSAVAPRAAARPAAPDRRVRRPRAVGRARPPSHRRLARGRAAPGGGRARAPPRAQDGRQAAPRRAPAGRGASRTEARTPDRARAAGARAAGRRSRGSRRSGRNRHARACRSSPAAGRSGSPPSQPR